MRVFTLFVFVLCLVSCEKELELDAEFKTTKLVVYSLFSNNEVWEVEVTNSLNILESKSFEFVDNANVEIQDEGGNLIERLVFQDSSYISAIGTKPQLDKTYRIKVSAPNFETVTSQGKCADNVPIISIDSSSSITQDRWVDKKYTCSLKFKDVAGKENYYAVILKLKRTEIDSNSWSVDTTVYQYDQSLYSRDPFNENNFLFNGPVLFKDRLFDGQEQIVNFTFSLFQSSDRKVIYDNKLQFISMTKEAYDYLMSSELFFERYDDPFSNPVQVYDNIEGGFGIFAGQSIYEIDF